MAAEIKPVHSPPAPKNIVVEKPILLAKIDTLGDVKTAKFLSGANTLLSLYEDRSIKIWQKRDSGIYWPSVTHLLQSIPIYFCYCEDNNSLFVGQDNGTITEFTVSKDFNSITSKRDYLAHQDKINSLIYSKKSKWILSISEDQYFAYHCVETGRRLGGHSCNAACTALQYDEQSNHVFIGDMSGRILMLRIDDKGCQEITSLVKHVGSVRSLVWEPSLQFLYSGSYDQSVIAWDIGGGKGIAYELCGHNGNVSSLKYISDKKKLFSGGEDYMIVSWDMSVNREQAPQWIECDNCQICDRPFFWNFRGMFEKKQVGLRQHHCRKCGKALCHDCSDKVSNYPKMGFELEVRMCTPCFQDVSGNDRISTAKFLEVKHSVVYLDVDVQNNILLTVGHDKIMKLWNATSLLN